MLMSRVLTYRSAGESHGPSLVAIVEGFPAGVTLERAPIDRLLHLRQLGYGRGPRMALEEDRFEFLAGLRRGKSLGSPIALSIPNRDSSIDDRAPITQPRPGHADLAGALKFATDDVQDILERASARETAARVAAGGLAEQLLALFDIDVLGYVVAVGEVSTPACAPAGLASRDRSTAGRGRPWHRRSALARLRRLRDKSPLFTLLPEREAAMKAAIDQARQAGDTVGGVVEVQAVNLPPGLGSYAQWCDRLDGRLAQALMSIPAVKGVEVGLGFEVARRPGSGVHDEIFYRRPRSASDRRGGFYRRTNHAGGLEGGITNGEPVILRAAVKPIPSLAKPLRSVDLLTRRPVLAAKERADVCVVAPAAIVAEAAVAFELAGAFLEKFGGDSLSEVRRNFEGYVRGLQKR
jgi:chorismate synthase